MSEENQYPQAGEQGESGAIHGRWGDDSPPQEKQDKVNDRPHRDAKLGELEEELVAVNLREFYTIPRDGHKQPHKGPKKLNMPLSDCKAHMHKLQEHELIRDRWKAIQREKEHRRAERNLAGDINQPATA